MSDSDYLQQVEATRPQRIRWFQEARFGLFIHWGLYSQLGRHEWVMNKERIPIPEYERLADTWQPVERPAREWARLAKAAGMKYMVLTTKHHEGFCLWDTQMTEYNAVRRGPRRDLVREFVDACREFGLKVGFYYSLMDWHHPDGARCAVDEAARRRFIAFTDGCVRELMTNYGPVDILWYDAAWPLRTADLWESVRRNRTVRDLQPHILINNRSWVDEDFGTPEGHVTAEKPGRAWESCMTFNGSWGYMPSAVDWQSARAVIQMLRTAATGQGNLLLNIGPKPDGSVPDEAYARLDTVGRWLAQNGEAVYGPVERADRQMEVMLTGHWSVKGHTAYFWCDRWPGHELTFGGILTPVVRVSYLTTGEPIAFVQQGERLILKGLPVTSPDTLVGVTVIKVEFAAPLRQQMGIGYVRVDNAW